MVDLTQLNESEKARLREFAEENGWFWKDKLRKAWMNGGAPQLQFLRNASFFGPEGLEKVRLKDLS
jgi:hypothetical protein